MTSYDSIYRHNRQLVGHFQSLIFKLSMSSVVLLVLRFCCRADVAGCVPSFFV